MAKKDLLADEDGNLIPPPAATSGIMDIIYLLEYGRRRGFQIGPTVQVGDTIVQVKDLRQQRDTEAAARQPELSIWQENGHDEG